MKILMTTDTVGGVWNYALELARELSHCNHSVLLASMGPLPTPIQRAEAAAIRNLHLYSRPYKLEWMHEPWADVLDAGQWLLELAYEAKPELIHLNNYVHATLPWSVPVLVVGHSCVLSWWCAVKGEMAPPEWNMYRCRVQAGLKSADMVVAPSRAMLSTLEEFYGRLPNSAVVYNGRRAQYYRSAAKQNSIFSIGRLWDDAKNIAALDCVAAQLPWPVYVAGSTLHPDGGERLFAQIHSLGVLDQKQIATYLSRAAIYALPARYEPFGLTILEAALSGCALVLSDIPTLRELWSNVALFVPADDNKALHHALTRLIEDPVLCRRLGAAARRRAQFFSSTHMADQYLALYQMLTETKSFEPCRQLVVENRFAAALPS